MKGCGAEYLISSYLIKGELVVVVVHPTFHPLPTITPTYQAMLDLVCPTHSSHLPHTTPPRKKKTSSHLPTGMKARKEFFCLRLQERKKL